MKTNEEKLNQILNKLRDLDYVKTNQIPNIELYMDQVTTFMDEHLKNTKRSPQDKILTKTMINNYAKNNLLPPPLKKKYSKEHMIVLIFIYYFKNILSFHDIEQLLHPLTENHFQTSSAITLEEIYKKICGMEMNEVTHLKEDIQQKFNHASQLFANKDIPEEELEYLELFSFMCQLSFDIYVKKQIIEQLLDDLAASDKKI